MTWTWSWLLCPEPCWLSTIQANTPDHNSVIFFIFNSVPFDLRNIVESISEKHKMLFIANFWTKRLLTRRNYSHGAIVPRGDCLTVPEPCDVMRRWIGGYIAWQTQMPTSNCHHRWWLTCWNIVIFLRMIRYFWSSWWMFQLTKCHFWSVYFEYIKN